MDKQIKKVKLDLTDTLRIFHSVIKNLASFEIASREALPYGLKPHTRSVSWLVEQVLVQKAKQLASSLGVSTVNYELPDTELHDLEITTGDRKIFINTKCHQVDKKQNKNDISAVVKLYEKYKNDPHYDLIYVAIGIKFENRSIEFQPDGVHCFSAQFLPIYVNPTNDKIQAFYKHTPVIRSRSEFLNALRHSSKTIKLE